MATKTVLIIGGGFGGIATALRLAKAKRSDLKIVLVSDRPHFEFHSALYRVVAGGSPLEVCISIREILANTNIQFAVDRIESIDLKNSVAYGTSGTSYRFDYSVLALGSETDYFNIPGLEKFSFGFKSITEAVALKNHIHKLFEHCSEKSHPTEDKVCLLHFVLVGGGPSGVELAGELAQYTKLLAKKYGISESLITIDLIEAAPRILPTFPENVSRKAARRLQNLGVKIFTSRPMIKEDLEEIQVRGMTMKTETVIWTAGSKPNEFHKKLGVALDPRGRVVVNDYLQIPAIKNVFVIGDGASTTYSGMAQTAIYDGKFVAKNILNNIMDRDLEKHEPQKPYYSLPIGSRWAVTMLGNFTLCGYFGWILRRAADLRYFLSILPIKKALLVFRRGKKLCETCEVCVE